MYLYIKVDAIIWKGKGANLHSGEVGPEKSKSLLSKSQLKIWPLTLIIQTAPVAVAPAGPPLSSLLLLPNRRRLSTSTPLHLITAREILILTIYQMSSRSPRVETNTLPRCWINYMNGCNKVESKPNQPFLFLFLLVLSSPQIESSSMMTIDNLDGEACCRS